MAVAKKAGARKPVTIDAPTPNLPVSISEEIQKELAEVGARVSAASGDAISTTQDKKFRFPDGAESDGPISGVILDFVYGNNFFDRPYREGEVTPAACFSRGMAARDLVPSDNSPVKQAESCGACPNNQFGSEGAGKACKNNVLLAVSAKGEDGPGDVFVLKVSPTSIKHWDSYVQMLRTKFNKLPIQVLTQIYFDPGVSYASLRFGNPELLTAEDIQQYFPLKAAARERLLQEPDVSQYEPPVAKPAARRPAAAARR